MKEIWKDVIGYEASYSISNKGRMYSKKRDIIRRINLDSNGYPCVGLSKRGTKTKKITIHLLLARHFIPNPENKPQVNHKNGVKIDYRIENLEWVTNKENIFHSFKVLKNGGRPRARNKKVTLEELDNMYIDSLSMGLKDISKKYGINHCVLTNILVYIHPLY